MGVSLCGKIEGTGGMAMLLKNYEKVPASAFNRLAIPAISEPFPILVHWFHTVDNRLKNYPINRRIHCHRFYEAHFIINGQMTYGDVDQTPYILTEGMGVLIPPGVQHIIQHVEDNCVRFSMCFDMKDLRMPEKIAMFSLPEVLIDGIDTVLYELYRPTAFSGAVLKNRIVEIIAAVLRELQMVPGEPAVLQTAMDQRIAAAKSYIRDNNHNFLTCGDVAAHCGLSVKQMERVFREVTGQRLLDCIHEEKLNAAKAYLEQEDRSIQQISDDLGFSSLSYFYRFFTKKEGVTPSFYRRYALDGKETTV